MSEQKGLYILKGLVFCAECGEELQLISKKLKTGTKPMLRCVKHIKNSQVCTKNHFIYYDDLLNEIQKQLNLHIEEVINSTECDKLCEAIFKSIYARVREVRINELEKELQAINKSIICRYKTLSSDGAEDELESLHYSQKYLMREIININMRKKNLFNINLDAFKNALKEYFSAYQIDEKTLKLFIKKIEIGHFEKNSSGAQQKIKIFYRF